MDKFATLTGQSEILDPKEETALFCVIPKIADGPFIKEKIAAKFNIQEKFNAKLKEVVEKKYDDMFPPTHIAKIINENKSMVERAKDKV